MGEAEVREAVASALRLVNMQDYMYRATHTLSGGQRQRVAIAGVVRGGSGYRRCGLWEGSSRGSPSQVHVAGCLGPRAMPTACCQGG